MSAKKRKSGLSDSIIEGAGNKIGAVIVIAILLVLGILFKSCYQTDEQKQVKEVIKGRG